MQEGCDVPCVCEISFAQAQVTVLLATSSMLMDQQYVLNKVSLNRNPHKTELLLYFS